MRHLARSVSLAVILLLAASTGLAQKSSGMVMNANATELPRDCARLAGDVEFTVRVGKSYASGFPGMVFGMDQHEYRVPPCSRVTITLVNEDEVRHQWMMHGLPRYLYPGGMFHLEASRRANSDRHFHRA